MYVFLCDKGYKIFYTVNIKCTVSVPHYSAVRVKIYLSPAGTSPWRKLCYRVESVAPWCRSAAVGILTEAREKKVQSSVAVYVLGNRDNDSSSDT